MKVAMKRAANAGLCLLASLVVSCASSTRFVTYPEPCTVLLDGVESGQSGEPITIPYRTFGDYFVVLKNAAGQEIYRETLPTDYFAGFVVWPIWAPAATYEIDTSVANGPDGQPGARPSGERTRPTQSVNAAVNIWTDMAFGYLDRGWMLEGKYYLDLSLQVDPTFADALLGLAIYFRQKGDDQQAQSYLDAWQARVGSSR